ncbi:MAG: HD domain-containing phosphohydrolase, partial [Gemmatimonadota bacterium]
TIVGDQLIGELRSLKRARSIIRHHHERYDGSGYPDGLRGDEIPLLAQIVGIVDVFDALTTERPYKSAMSFAAAAAELRVQTSEGAFRPDLMEKFLGLVEQGTFAAG